MLRDGGNVMKIVIKDFERGLLFKNGNYRGVLQPGKHFFFPFLDTSVKVLDNTKPFFVEGYDIEIFLKDEKLRTELEIIDVADKEIAVHYIDDKFQEVLATGKYAFWKALKKHSFSVIDISQPEIAEDIDKKQLLRPQFRSYAGVYDVEAYM
jgi:regulator of protease activity HflC (stomatin/prohibitin superfamily)